MSIEFILAEMVEKRIRAGEVERKRLEDAWNEMAVREARAEIDRVLSVFDSGFEILEHDVKRVIDLRWPNGNPYAKRGLERGE